MRLVCGTMIWQGRLTEQWPPLPTRPCAVRKAKTQKEPVKFSWLYGEAQQAAQLGVMLCCHATASQVSRASVCKACIAGALFRTPVSL